MLPGLLSPRNNILSDKTSMCFGNRTVRSFSIINKPFERNLGAKSDLMVWKRAGAADVESEISYLLSWA